MWGPTDLRREDRPRFVEHLWDSFGRKPVETIGIRVGPVDHLWRFPTVKFLLSLNSVEALWMEPASANLSDDVSMLLPRSTDPTSQP